MNRAIHPPTRTPISGVSFALRGQNFACYTHRNGSRKSFLLMIETFFMFFLLSSSPFMARLSPPPGQKFLCGGADDDVEEEAEKNWDVSARGKSFSADSFPFPRTRLFCFNCQYLHFPPFQNKFILGALCASREICCWGTFYLEPSLGVLGSSWWLWPPRLWGELSANRCKCFRNRENNVEGEVQVQLGLGPFAWSLTSLTLQKLNEILARVHSMRISSFNSFPVAPLTVESCWDFKMHLSAEEISNRLASRMGLIIRDFSSRTAQSQVLSVFLLRLKISFVELVSTLTANFHLIPLLHVLARLTKSSRMGTSEEKSH